MKEQDRVFADSLYQMVCAKMKPEAERTGEMIPFLPIQGRYRDLMIPGGIYWWCNGFYPGMLWQMYHATGEEVYKVNAEKIGQRLLPIVEHPEKTDHDIGFLLLPSIGAELLCGGDSSLKEKLIRAADTLCARQNSLGFLEAWNPGTLGSTDVSGMMIADTMMNLSLLFLATEWTGDGRYEAVARSHADLALKYIVREDGSSNHIAKFSLEEGIFKEYPVGQGYASGSSWARGQSWTLYGYANAWKHTGDSRYLDASVRSAEYCIAELEKRDFVPPIDFRAPMDDGKYDSSAGTAIAAGLLNLAECCGPEQKERYEEAAIRLLQVCVDRFADPNPETDGIMAGASLRYHDDRMAGMKIIYADYFLVEAALKLQGKALNIW